MDPFITASYAMAAVFLLCALAFLLFGEKAVVLIGHHNVKNEQERRAYNEKKLARSMARCLLLWGVLFRTCVYLVRLFGPTPFLICLSPMLYFAFTGRICHGMKDDFSHFKIEKDVQP